MILSCGIKLADEKNDIFRLRVLIRADWLFRVCQSNLGDTLILGDTTTTTNNNKYIFRALNSSVRNLPKVQSAVQAQLEQQTTRSCELSCCLFSGWKDKK